MGEDDIAYYLADGDLTLYDKILDDRVERIYKTYYIRKVKDVNELISQLNHLREMEIKSKSIKR